LNAGRIPELISICYGRKLQLPSTFADGGHKTSGDFGIALVGFALLTAWRAPPLLVVAVSALGGVALATIG
jgi:hypothetical protein